MKKIKPPRELPSRIKERKRDDKYDTRSSGNLDEIRADYEGKKYPEAFKGTKLDGNHRIDDSVTKHNKNRAVPQEQYEIIYNATPQGIPDDPAGAFLPMPGRIRPVPHKKVNECDY